jgi:hypothetical protein
MAHGESLGGALMVYKCGGCGRFCRYLYPVWGFRPTPEIDYEVGECCATKEQTEWGKQ